MKDASRSLSLSKEDLSCFLRQKPTSAEAKAKGRNERQLSGFTSAKKPSPRQRMSSGNNKLLIFSPSFAKFPFAYKYMYYRLVKGSILEGEHPLLGFSSLLLEPF